MKLKDNAIVPTRGTKYGARYDISAAKDEPLKIKSKQTVMIPTGFCTEFEIGTVV